MSPATRLLPLLFVISASAFAGDWTVDFAPARKRVVPSQELALYCRGNREIEGCTEFLGEILRCRCLRADDGWRMTARAQLVPYMYVTRPPLEGHEQLHLDDLREQIGRLLEQLTAQRFADPESCRGAAEFEMTVFNLRMDLMRKLSNARLH